MLHQERNEVEISLGEIIHARWQENPMAFYRHILTQLSHTPMDQERKDFIKAELKRVTRVGVFDLEIV